MAMKNPPRRTTIRGQKHLLAYITPEEAALLKARGGSGELHHGIPSYADASMGGGWGGTAGDNDGDPGTSGGNDGGGRADGMDSFDSNYTSAAETAAQAAIDAAAKSGAKQGKELGMSPLESMAKYGTTALAGLTASQAPDPGSAAAMALGRELAAKSNRGFDVNLAKAMTQIAMAPPSQKTNWVDRMIMDMYQTGKQPGLLGMLGFDLGRTKGFTRTENPDLGIFESFQNQAPSFGTIGLFSDIFGLDPYVTTGFGKSGMGTDEGGAGPETIPATTNPVTGEQDQCPDGYMFDEDLQACRLAGGLPGGDGQVMTTSGPYEAGDYARMGLLDLAPMGMGLFAHRYGAGFGTPSDFSTANLAFRRGAATRPQYFRQAPDLTGYTLLS